MTKACKSQKHITTLYDLFLVSVCGLKTMDSLYLRNWRRVESTIKQWATEDEENSMELESTHDDEDISNIDTASGSDDEGCDREAVWLESENETEATSESDLGSDLADWALANKLTHKSVNELL